MNDLPNASNRKAIRAQEKASRIADRQRREVIGEIMATKAGRSWLWDTLSSCSIFSTTHVPADPLGSAYQEGRRSVGLALLADIMAHVPDQFITAMREHNERHNSNDRGPDATDPASERRLGPLADGGDSGTGPDSSEPSDDEADRVIPSTFGADIYADPATGNQTH